MTTKRYLTRRGFMRSAGGSAAAAMFLAACGQTPPEPVAQEPAPAAPASNTAPPPAQGAQLQPSAQPEVKELILASANPNYATQAIYWIAREMGYFEEEGFTKVEIATVDENFRGIVGGSINFGDVDASDVFVAATNNVPVKMLGTWRDREWQILGLSPSIKSPEDLRGKSMIIGTPGTREFAMRADAIRRWSGGTINPDTDLNQISISGASDAWNQALLSDQVQLAAQFPRHVKSIRAAGGDIVLGGWLELPQEGFIGRQDFIEQNPQTTVNLMRALLKARRVWLDYTRKDEIIALMRNNNFNISDDFAEAYYAEPEQYSIDGGFRMQAMNTFISQLAAFDVVPASLRYEAFTDLRYLHQAQREILGMQWPTPTDQSLFALYS